MTRDGRALIGAVLLVLASGVAGCDSTPVAPAPPPTARSTPVPSPAPTPPAPQEVRVVVFHDFITGIDTSDVRDARGRIVRFNTAGSLILADGREFPSFPMASGYDRDSIGTAWGSEDGERRVYLTFNPDYWHYPPPASLVDFEVVDGKLVIRHPDPAVPVPGS